MEGTDLTQDEIATLFKIPLFSRESALIQTAAREKSEKACASLAEVHAQIGLNIAPCPMNCFFCSFAAENKVFSEHFEISIEEATSLANQSERDGANAIYIMSTAQYPFEKFLEAGQEIRRSLKQETVLVANTGDLTEMQAGQLRDSGFSGIYHAVRMGEGLDTSIPPEKRLKTFEHAGNAGLRIGTCVEPVGTEHSVEELVQKTIITREARPVYSGSARRIPIPNTKMASFGIVSEAKMAHILGVVRLALGNNIPGNCTHEPNVIGAAAGANLLWAETGSNPRDTEEDTSGKRGMTVEDCKNVFREAEWDILSGPSLFYRE